MQRRAPAAASGATPIHSSRRPPPWQHSFQFSPRFRLITLTSLRLPLSGALIRYPLHFTPFYLSLSLSVCVCLPFSPLFSLSLSVPLIVRGFKRLSIWEQRVSELWFFIPVTETCWSLLIQNERVRRFCLFKGGSWKPRRACKAEKVTHDSFCLFISAGIIFLSTTQHSSNISIIT